MTDPDLVRKKLAAIETYVADLRRLTRPDALGQDVKEERFVEHTFVRATRVVIQQEM